MVSKTDWVSSILTAPAIFQSFQGPKLRICFLETKSIIHIWILPPWIVFYASVAQLDRALDYEVSGWGFESLQMRHVFSGGISRRFFKIRSFEKNKGYLVYLHVLFGQYDRNRKNKKFYAPIAQLEEHWSSKPVVGGSSPSGCAIFMPP